jgi:putative isomerase
MGTRDVSPERAWNTWDPTRPAVITYLPAGLSLSLQAYSTKAREYTDFPFGPRVRLKPRDTWGQRLALTVDLADTVLDLSIVKPDPFVVTGHLAARRLGEWGLRFWVLLEFGFDNPDGSGVVVRGPGARALSRGRPTPILTPATAGELEAAWPSEPEEGAHLLALWRSYAFSLTTDPTPLYAHLTEEAGAVGRTMADGGYFEPQSFRREGRVGVLAFNLEESPAINFAIAAAGRESVASARARTVLFTVPSAPSEDVLPDTPSGDHLRQAIESVLAWNTVVDTVNRRWFTALTRNWVQKKFGGWLVWLNDLLYHALLAAWAGDMELARKNLEAVWTSQTPEGNFPCLVSEFTEWVDRSQPPIAGHVVWRIYLLSGDASLVRWAYPGLVRNHRWWLSHRDGNGNGLLEYGTDLTGSGSFLRTALAARDESSMDNSPIHDGARLDPVAGTLNLEDVALNTLMVEDAECLAAMARLMGEPDDAHGFEDEAASRRARIRSDLWDPARGIFANRRWDGSFVEALAPTSFFPWAAGVPDADQTAALLRHLQDPAMFGGPAGLPGTQRSHPAAADNVYWRGRIWPPLNYWVYQGLRRYGLDDDAARLARHSVRLFWAGWREQGASFENFNGETGQGDDSPDTDRFYTWGALMPLLGIQELIDVNPWDGFTIGSRYPGRIDRVIIRGQEYGVRVTADATELYEDGRRILAVDQALRIRGLAMSPTRWEMVLPASEKPVRVSFLWPSASTPTARLEAADGGATPLSVETGADGPRTIIVPAQDTPRRLTILAP